MLEVQRLLRQYNAMVPTRMLVFARDPEKRFPWNDVALQSALVHMVKEPLCAQWPPGVDYTRSVLKMAIVELERRDIEVSDELYELYATALKPLLVPGDAEEDGRETDVEHLRTGFKTYTITDDVRVVLREHQAFISSGTTGLVTWQASMALVDALVCDPSLRVAVQGRVVLELGSGVGFLGLAVAALCAPLRTVLTDCHAGVLQALEDNLARNRALGHLAPGSLVDIELLDWCEGGGALLERTAPDVVLAADVVYDTDLLQPLARVLESALLGRACIALIACTVRNPSTLAKFVGMLDAMHMEVDTKPLALTPRFDYEDYTDVVLLRARPASRD